MTENQDRHDRARCQIELDAPLAVLSPQQIRIIDQALEELGPFSEVRLIKDRGRLRYIIRVESRSISAEG